MLNFRLLISKQAKAILNWIFAMYSLTAFGSLDGILWGMKSGGQFVLLQKVPSDKSFLKFLQLLNPYPLSS